MSENEFVFCIGYDGIRAIIDKELLGQHKDKSVEELFNLGFYRSAFSKAFYRKDDALIDYLIKRYNNISNSTYSRKEELELLFGVIYPDDIANIKVTYV
ncbi:hypothetical protein BDCR2A_00800 [Borrelia duttonii CR2A]|uniref:Uncharacterized protein n=3 Tax=Borrelia TaxID=138 RepID=W6TID3_9SPIR|nr:MULTISPECIES: hypothetical protein [Borrelia]ACH93582.1 uncharacterized conserved protein [Borrelia duttonii Ly]ACH94876.1 uncharacterized conserved protein [Borrelia recurrentis A1]ETZ18827.1 hypothetical protein BDCR2A_00800 [Borrelia duttonii CR2A]